MVGKEEGKAWGKAHNSMCECSCETMSVYVRILACVHVFTHSHACCSPLLAGFYSDATVKNRAALQEPFVQIANCLSTVGEKGLQSPQGMHSLCTSHYCVLRCRLTAKSTLPLPRSTVVMKQWSLCSLVWLARPSQ